MKPTPEKTLREKVLTALLDKLEERVKYHANPYSGKSTDEAIDLVLDEMVEAYDRAEQERMRGWD